MSIIARHRLLLGISALLIISIALLPRFAQDPAYLDYADKRSFLGIPNSADVLSNLLFAWVGLHGLYLMVRRGRLKTMTGLESAYAGFFASLVMVALASGYYHWSPDYATLALDRLAISFIFASIFAAMLGERVSLPLARRLYPLFLALGIGSVAYWYFSEIHANGDLRGYLLVQLLPLVLIPLMLQICAPRFSRSGDIWWLLGWFVVARICEILDQQIFDWFGFVSGHTLKHIAAGVAGLVYLRHLQLRKPLTA